MNRGIILGPDGQKMSKSRGNVVDPDDYVKRLGADTVRTYLAFIGPYNEVGSYPWSPDSIIGVRRFLERVWKVASEKLDSGKADEVLLHKSIKDVTESIDKLKMNTAVPTLMTFMNSIEKSGITKEQFETFLKLLAPFAPHITEELWETLGHKGSIHTEKWPEYDEKKLLTDEITLAVQVDGKVRGNLTIPRGLDEALIREKAVSIPQVAKWLEGKNIVKILVIQDKIVSIVTK
jgi:leucyl-tRNA synthetase